MVCTVQACQAISGGVQAKGQYKLRTFRQVTSTRISCPYEVQYLMLSMVDPGLLWSPALKLSSFKDREPLQRPFCQTTDLSFAYSLGQSTTLHIGNF